MLDDTVMSVDSNVSDDNMSAEDRIPTTTSLDSLQSSEQRNLMDLIDSLRRAGLDKVLQLPQIVVCGDQSSGKSSVLEALTEIPFPRKENLCTRFATEISMRRSAESEITCKINPYTQRSQEEKERLHSFERSIQNFDELPNLIEEATNLMGLSSERAFSRDVLSIVISGPKRQPLTIVDLPGLIHSASKVQSEEDVELIQDLVNDYISEKRTIILAVVSAKNDYANQIILKKCRKVDPRGTRTLGVVTKPDFLKPKSENEQSWLNLVRNQDIHFELGWHIIKNRDEDQHNLTFQQRNTQERIFLGSGSYKSLNDDAKGIENLRKKMSSLLFRHQKQELPALEQDLHQIVKENDHALEILGRSRDSLADKRVYLTGILIRASNLTERAIQGHYEDEFFGAINEKVPIQTSTNAFRLRAVIQHLNMEFAENMRKKGHTYAISESKQEKEEPVSSESESEEETMNTKTDLPKRISRKAATSKALKYLQRNRGRELPGTFNPLLIHQLFQNQSVKWTKLAQTHLEHVALCRTKFIHRVFDACTNQEVKDHMMRMTIDPALNAAYNAALQEFQYITTDKHRHPITYNHYFTDTIQKIELERQKNLIMSLTEKATVTVSEKTEKTERTHNGGVLFKDNQYINPKGLEALLGGTIQRNMDKFSAQQALDASEAFYKGEMKYFIEAVTKQVIERHLIAPLSEIISPLMIARYSDKEINLIASEPPEAVQKRKQLEEERILLQAGKDAFRLALDKSIQG